MLSNYLSLKHLPHCVCGRFGFEPKCRTLYLSLFICICLDLSHILPCSNPLNLHCVIQYSDHLPWPYIFQNLGQQTTCRVDQDYDRLWVAVSSLTSNTLGQLLFGNKGKGQIMRDYISGEGSSLKDSGIHRNRGDLSTLPQPQVPPWDPTLSPKSQHT